MRKLFYNPENCTFGNAVSKGAAPPVQFSLSGPPLATEAATTPSLGKVDCKGASNQIGKLAGALLALAMFAMPNLGWTQTMSSITFDPSLPNAGNGCNAPAAVVDIVMFPAIAGNGLQYLFQYDVTGLNVPVVGMPVPGVFSQPAAINNIPAGPHCMTAVTVTTANNAFDPDGPGPLPPYPANTVVAIDNDCFYIGLAGPPGPAPGVIIDISSFNLTCATTIFPPATPTLPGCWQYEYSIDGNPVFAPVPPGGIPVTPGCHTISRRVACTLPPAGNGPFGCGAPGAFPATAPVDFVIFNNLSALTDAQVITTTDCDDVATVPLDGALSAVSIPSIGVIPGISYQYSVDGAAFTSTLPITGLGFGCHTLTIRQISNCPNTGADGTSSAPCLKTLSFMVFPSLVVPAPVVLQNGTCATPTNITLPANLPALPVPVLPATGSFVWAYSLDGGPYSTTLPAAVGVGCHTLRVKLVTGAACGNTPAGSDGAGLNLAGAPNTSALVSPTCLSESPATNFTLHLNLSATAGLGVTQSGLCAAFPPALPASTSRL